MKTPDTPAPSGSLPSVRTARRRLAALERLIAYARDEAEKLNADVLAFCLDASLSVARGETPDLGTGTPKRRGERARRSLPH